MGAQWRVDHVRVDHAFDCVFQRKGRNGRACELGSREAAVKQLGRRQRTSRVVDSQPLRGRRRETGRDRVAPTHSADDHPRIRRHHGRLRQAVAGFAAVTQLNRKDFGLN